MMKRWFLSILLSLSVCVSAFSSERMPEDSVFVTLNEINITALKQSGRLDEEPQASTVLSGREVEQLGIVSMRGVSDVVPNFFMPDYGSRITSTIYVRGIGARMDQPSVGLNVDNVPYLNKDAYDFDISDIASVVMLRGPQSTLYGRNTMAGVINITTLSPLAFQGWRAFLEAGNGGRVRANVGWYHKFTSKTGLSISGDYGHLEGFYRNEYNNAKTDKENSFSLRTKFLYEPRVNLQIQNVAGANILRQGGYPYEYVGTGRIEYNDTCFYRRFTFTDGLTVGYRNKDFTLTSITSVQHIDDNMTLDQDFLPESYFTLTQKKRETSLTEELVFRGSAVDSRYSWLAGAMGFYKHLNMNAPVTFKDVGIRELIESHRNENNLSYPIAWDTRQFVLNSKFTIPTYGFAIYHESDFTLDNWNFEGSLRLDYERSDLNYHSFCNTGYQIYQATADGYEPYRHVDIDINDRGHLKKDFLTLLPKVAVTYRFSSGLGNVYINIAKGYKAGGFNTQMFSDVLQQRLMKIMGVGSQYDVEDVVAYKPEKSWNYEIGSHLHFPSRRLDLEISAFYIDCRDQQLTMFPDGTTTGRIMANAGKTRSFGAELSASLQASSSLFFNLSYGYTNAKFREFFNGIKDYKGKWLPYVPSNTLFLQGLYELPLGKNPRVSNKLVFDLNMRGTGPIYWNEENTLRQNFYAQLGASVSWQWRDWEFKAWGRNLTNTQFHTFYFLSMGNEFLQRGRGIEGGISVRWSLRQ
ncbi:MAG: TonB-dependent receptor [Muribaculaceae bacterium]|nr:TonB-dependent receptor [Muribaculaceae bacterium]